MQSWQELRTRLECHLGVMSKKLRETNSNVELGFYSRTNVELFQIRLFKSDTDGWIIGGQGPLLYGANLDELSRE